MANYDSFNSGNYSGESCRDNSIISYNGIMNSGNHGSYSGKEDYSMEKFGNPDSFGLDF
jgi:hypothetical protein